MTAKMTSSGDGGGSGDERGWCLGEMRHGRCGRQMLMQSGGRGHGVTESGLPLSAATAGVVVVGAETVNGVSYVALDVLSGEYQFASAWTRERAARRS